MPCAPTLARLHCFRIMSLKQLWTSAADSRMPLKEQCKLWALREVLRMQGEDDTRYGWMSTKVLLGNGKNPGRNAVRTFFRRVDKAGHAWYPGHYTGKPGRKLALTPHKRRAIATSMMAAKKRGAEPSYDLARALAPIATFNETTQAPFTRKVINVVLTTDCYDNDPERPWEFRFGAKRRALTVDEKEYRMDWAKRLLEEDHSAAWYRDNILWIDINSKVIPGPQRRRLTRHRRRRTRRSVS